MPYLIVKSGTLEGSRIDLTPPKVSFGRLDSCTINLQDQNISRTHAECDVFENGIVALVDLCSSNGTFVNGLPISRIFLMDGDEIRMGETILEYHDSDAAVSGELTKRPQFSLMKTNIKRTMSSSSSMETFLMQPEEIDVDVLKETYLKLRTINKLLLSLSKCHKPDEAFNSIGEGIILSTPAERVSFFLLDRFSNEPLLEKTRLRKNLTEKDSAKNPVNNEALKELVKEPAPSMFYIDGDEDFDKNSEDSKELRKKCRCLGAPILQNDKLIGFIIADIFCEDAAFSRNDLDLIAAIASHLSEITDRLSEVDTLRRKNYNLEKLVAGDLTIICRNKKMQKILDTINQVAQSNSSVLILGESGTGKELIAKAIHYYSNLRNKPIVCINCASLPESLLESELFGYERGAFTGAITRKPGKFETADGGTIFLDEIGDIPLSAQAKLLRIIQEGEFERLGGTQTIRINVRIISATNKDLAEEIKAKRFREDLYYRINVVRIELPPLRERTEDIPVLAEYFLKTLKNTIPSRAQKFSDETLKIFMEYPWRGNIRELRNVIERALVYCKSEIIGPELLQAEILHIQGNTPEIQGSNTNYRAINKEEDMSLSSVEKRHIRKVLTFVNGNKQKAAEILKISRTTLYEKMKDLD